MNNVALPCLVKNKRLYLLTFFILFSLLFSPFSVVAWEANIKDNKNVPLSLVVVDKSQQRLQYLEQKDSPFVLVYPSIHGQKEGDKMEEGDMKTPEGVYFITTKIKMKLDFDEYGSQAHALNYPNPIDRLRGKTGGGIWIHSKGSPIYNQTTQGCVAIDLDDIEELGRHLTAGMPVLIAQTVDTGFSMEIEEKHIPPDQVSQASIDTTLNTANTNVTQEDLAIMSEQMREQLTHDGEDEEIISTQIDSDDPTAQSELLPTALPAQHNDTWGEFSDDTLDSVSETSSGNASANSFNDTFTNTTTPSLSHVQNLNQENTHALSTNPSTQLSPELSPELSIDEQIRARAQMLNAQNNPPTQENSETQTQKTNLNQIVDINTSEQNTTVLQSENNIYKSKTEEEQIILNLTKEWNNAWADRSQTFFDFYDKETYSRAHGQSFSKFSDQKEHLFKNLSWLFISYQDINILEGPGYWVTWFPQYYRAPNHKTEGMRRLYWQKNEEHEYKIVAMEWLPRNFGLDSEFTKHVNNTVPQFIEAWRTAWLEADAQSYVTFYTHNAQQDSIKGLGPIMDKKQSIWAVKTPTKIDFTNLHIDERSNTIHVYMDQDYADSSGYRDYGIKRLTLHPNGSSWIIVSEGWSRKK